jgi:hypothetical protein
MKTLIISILFLASVSAQSQTHSWNDPRKPFDATKNIHKKVKIEWIVVEDVVKECNKQNEKYGFPPLGPLTACSFWFGNNCKIITSTRATMHELGHEVRHCFQGAWH